MPMKGQANVGEASTLVDQFGNALVSNSETISASSAKSAGSLHQFDLSVYRSGIIVCDVTAFAGGTSPTIQFELDVLDAASGKWIPIATPAAGAAGAVETVIIFLDETTSALPTAASFRYVQGHPLLGGVSTGAQSPAGTGNYRVKTTFTGAPTSITYSVGFLGRPF